MDGSGGRGVRGEECLYCGSLRGWPRASSSAGGSGSDGTRCQVPRCSGKDQRVSSAGREREREGEGGMESTVSLWYGASYPYLMERWLCQSLKFNQNVGG